MAAVSATSRALPAPVSAAPLRAAPTPGAQASTARGGGDDDHGGSGIGGFFGGLVHKIFNPRTLMFAGLGAAAAMYIPPLAFLGGPIGGAIGGALLSMVI